MLDPFIGIKQPTGTRTREMVPCIEPPMEFFWRVLCGCCALVGLDAVDEKMKKKNWPGGGEI